MVIGMSALYTIYRSALLYIIKAISLFGLCFCALMTVIYLRSLFVDTLGYYPPWTLPVIAVMAVVCWIVWKVTSAVLNAIREDRVATQSSKRLE
jgi:hypothetical protein